MPKSAAAIELVRQKSRENILRSALLLFSEKGFFNTSIRDIARKAQISDGLLYNYYKSKDELALGVLETAFNTLDEVIPENQTAQPSEALKTIISDFIDMIENQTDKMRLLAQMGLHKEKFEMINQLTVSKYKTSVSRISAQLKKKRIANPEAEATFLVAILDGLVFERLLMDNAIDLKQLKKELIKKYCDD